MERRIAKRMRLLRIRALQQLRERRMMQKNIVLDIKQ